MGVFDPLDTLIAALSELGEGKEKPAAEKRKTGWDEKRDSWERKERIRGEEQKHTPGLTSTRTNQCGELRRVNKLHPNIKIHLNQAFVSGIFLMMKMWLLIQKQHLIKSNGNKI